MKPFVTFKNIGNKGRLGNQLWQYAALRAASLRNNCDVRIPPTEYQVWHGQTCMLEKNFHVNVHPLTWRESNIINKKFVEKDPFKFDSSFLDIKPYTDIDGFFQSINYFEEYQDVIRNELWPKLETNDHCPVEKEKKYINNLKSEHDCDIIVSLHMRRGDNTDGSIPSQYKILKNIYGDGDLDKNSIYYQYFLKSKKIIEEKFKDKKLKYLIFTGGSREKNNPNNSDIEWCKKHFQGASFLFSESGSEMVDFCRIMSCDANILGHLSSFGWWATYMGMQCERNGHVDENKVIICPENYHCDRNDINYRVGFYPKSWIIA